MRLRRIVKGTEMEGRECVSKEGEVKHLIL